MVDENLHVRIQDFSVWKKGAMSGKSKELSNDSTVLSDLKI
jgi:hypothetical protein